MMFMVFLVINNKYFNLLGAHTLGGARPQNSGYEFLWIPGGQLNLDNQFYIDLASKNMSWVQVGDTYYPASSN